jgi:anhydro-N-acetylmuramic acid kinase
MIYKVIGLMSGSSLDGIDITYVELTEKAGNWNYEIIHAACVEYEPDWLTKLKTATELSGKDYQLLHSEYGKYLGEKINHFIAKNELFHKVNLIASHGHTTFHFPEKHMTHQLGDGAAIAAETKLPVVSDLRALDIALGGQGAPIVPLGEKLLFPENKFFLNLGGIANVSVHEKNTVIAFDICPANRVLNILASQKGKEYDANGQIAKAGNINADLLNQLNALEYYFLPAPKSLANSFGTDIVFSLIKSFALSTEDAMRTYVEHICVQIKNSLQPYFSNSEIQKLLITGGGAFNTFLIDTLSVHLNEINFQVELPESEVVKYKEALIMALLGIRRWREQYTVLSSVTGATQNSIGGALWLGTDA